MKLKLGLEEHRQLANSVEQLDRPSLPTMLIPVAALWISIMLSEVIAWQSNVCEDGLSVALLGNVSLSTVLLACFIFLIIAIFIGLVVWKRSGISIVLLISVAACLGLFIGTLYWSSTLNIMKSVSSEGTYKVEVISDSNNSSTTSWSEGKIIKDNNSSVSNASVRIIWDSADSALPLGTCFLTTGKFTQIGSKEKNQSKFQSGIVGNLYPKKISETAWSPSLLGTFGSIRHHFATLLRKNTSEGEILLEGIVLGNRSNLSGTELDEAFKITGLSHLLAVSGSHLAIVAMMIAWLLQKTKVSKRVSIVVLCVLVISYLVLTGVQPSAFRACIMSLVGSAAWLFRRRKNSMPALCIAVMLMLVLDPTNAFSVGFGLSVMGVFGICIFLPLAQKWLEQIFSKKLDAISQPLAMTLVAQACTSQISVPIFGMFSLVGPLANIVAGPVISILLGAGIIAMLICAVSEQVGQILLHILCALSDVFCKAVEAVSSLPHAAIPAYVSSAVAWTVFVVVAILLWVFWPSPNKQNIKRAGCGIACICVFVLALSLLGHGTQVVMLDVGQGDAILVRDKNTQILIDTGRSDTKLRSALGRNRVYHLDAVVLTHFDDDHCGSLSALKSMVDVDKVVLATGSTEFAKDNASGATAIEAATKLVGVNNIVEIACGSKIKISNNLGLTAVWPQTEIKEGGNSQSLCTKLEYDYDQDCKTDFSMLLTGDAESEELEEMIKSGVGHIDALKVGHHGSAVSVSSDTLESLDPSVALISVGAGNSYGHPSSKTLNLLNEQDVKVWRTDLDGDITLQLAPSGYRVSCANI